MATILVCEDEAPVADLLSQVCRDAGHDAVATGTGEECMTKGRELCPPLMFLDVMLPGGVSGYEICRYFRELASTKAAYIVIVTARTGSEVQRTAARAGADELVHKPFRLATIESIIERVLGDGADPAA